MPDIRPTVNASRSLLYRLAWLTFAFACFQMVFLQPYETLFEGQRANVFSGILCGLAGITALLLVKKRRPKWRRSEILICFVLSGLATASALCSQDPFSAGLRVFVLLTSSLGGFWCARILLNDSGARTLFQCLCAGLLIGALLLGFVSYFALGRPSYIFREHEHPFNTVILLLWVGPLGLLAHGRRRVNVILLGLVCLGSVLIILSGKMSAAWIPLLVLAMGGVFFTRKKARMAAMCLILIAISIALSIFYVPAKYGPMSLSVWFRAENYPFSLHIAKKHPFLGIGLWSERERYLDDYETLYPDSTRDRFRQVLQTNRTHENTFLTFMTDLGFPFALIYAGSVLCLLWSLIISLPRKPEESSGNPLVLLIPLLGALLYFQLYDGLLFPQVSWFFHILLGMIPIRES